MLAKVQTLRGRIYMEDAAIEQTDLAPDGRHYIASDEESWHILTLDNAGTVCGCARYLAHENTISFTRLGLRHSPLAKCDQWGKSSVLRSSRRSNRRTGEILPTSKWVIGYAGGWALLVGSYAQR